MREKSPCPRQSENVPKLLLTDFRQKRFRDRPASIRIWLGGPVSRRPGALPITPANGAIGIVHGERIGVALTEMPSPRSAVLWETVGSTTKEAGLH